MTATEVAQDSDLGGVMEVLGHDRPDELPGGQHAVPLGGPGSVELRVIESGSRGREAILCIVEP